MTRGLVLSSLYALLCCYTLFEHAMAAESSGTVNAIAANLAVIPPSPQKIGTFSNSDFCDGYGVRKSFLFPVYVLHFDWQPSSLRAGVRTAGLVLSTKREYIFFFSNTVIIFHFTLISFPKASTQTSQNGIKI